VHRATGEKECLRESYLGSSIHSVSTMDTTNPIDRRHCHYTYAKRLDSTYLRTKAPRACRRTGGHSPYYPAIIRVGLLRHLIGRCRLAESPDTAEFNCAQERESNSLLSLLIVLSLSHLDFGILAKGSIICMSPSGGHKINSGTAPPHITELHKCSPT